MLSPATCGRGLNFLYPRPGGPLASPPFTRRPFGGKADLAGLPASKHLRKPTAIRHKAIEMAFLEAG
ncbi:MAG: hypothetical protein ACYST2_05725 [Planctomycetota bacterium]